MADKVTVRLSSAAAALVRKDAPRPEKLKAARGEVPLGASDLGNVLLFLSMDADVEVRAAAVRSLRNMPQDLQLVMARSPETHPKVLEVLTRLHPAHAELLAASGHSSPEAAHPGDPVTDSLQESKGEREEPGEEKCGGDEGEVGPDEDDGPVDEQGEEYLSKYKLCLQMDTADKIKYALTGDKEWRTILIKESNKLVSSAVIKNPRITEAEVLGIAKSKIQNDDILRLICLNKDWLKNYHIRKALVENVKTPLPKALRFMSTLTDKDLSSLSKSKNVTTVIATQARRLLMAKNK